VPAEKGKTRQVGETLMGNQCLTGGVFYQKGGGAYLFSRVFDPGGKQTERGPHPTHKDKKGGDFLPSGGGKTIYLPGRGFKMCLQRCGNKGRRVPHLTEKASTEERGEDILFEKGKSVLLSTGIYYGK